MHTVFCRLQKISQRHFCRRGRLGSGVGSACRLNLIGKLNNCDRSLSLSKDFRSRAMNREISTSLLYRYFFFSWLFRDVDRGDWLERSAAWRYNQAHSHWLLIYLKRWVVLALFVFAVASLSSLVFAGHWICIPFYVMFSVAIPVSSVIVVAWLGLRLLPGP
jgi:hypothetical protein